MTLNQMLTQLERDRFYGTFEIQYEAGNAILFRKHETIKPPHPNAGANRINREDNHEQPKSR